MNSISSIKLDLPFENEPDLYNVGIRLRAPYGKTDGALIDDTYCRARDSSYDRAVTKALGEAVERYPFTLYRDSDFLSYSFKECRDQSVEYLDITKLDTYPQYDQTKNNLKEYEEKKKIAWTKAIKILPNHTTVDALLPAQCVYWNYQNLDKNYPVLYEQSTHGGASYPTFIGALNRALYEWIGRDGFFYHWGLGISPLKIELASLPLETNVELKKLLKETHELGFTVEFLDVTSPKVPVPSIACVLTDTNTLSSCKVTVGASCEFDIVSACLGALSEAWGVHQWLQTFYPKPTIFKKTEVTQWTDKERLTYFASGEGDDSLAFFIAGTTKPYTFFVDTYDLKGEQSENDYFIKMCDLLHAHDDVRVYYAVPKKNIFYEHTKLHTVRTFVSGLITPYQSMKHLPRESLLRRSAFCNNRAYGNINVSPHPYP